MIPVPRRVVSSATGPPGSAGAGSGPSAPLGRFGLAFAGRLGVALATLLGATGLMLGLLVLAPGDPIDLIPNGAAIRPQLEKEFGLDRPRRCDGSDTSRG